MQGEAWVGKDAHTIDTFPLDYLLATPLQALQKPPNASRPNSTQGTERAGRTRACHKHILPSLITKTEPSETRDGQSFMLLKEETSEGMIAHSDTQLPVELEW